MNEILNRITEQEINEWMIAKLKELRAGKLPGLHYIHCDAHKGVHVEPSPYVTWGMQASGACAVSHKNIHEAVTELLKDINDNPASKASEKRRNAKALLQEAEELEALAKTL